MDKALVDRGLFPTRSAARGAIVRGDVLVDGTRELKPGRRVDSRAALEALAPAPVGRGALKLQGALEAFGMDPAGKAVLDVGASTGGFTETLLQRGAARVWALDVGRGQLHPDLDGDPRVVNLEGTDIRRLNERSLDAPVDLATVDVSFISLEKVLPSLATVLRRGTPVIALIKPQFEAGPEDVGGGGIVRRREVHLRVVESILEAMEDLAYRVEAVVPSPILDPDANLEFFVLAWYVGAPAGRKTPRRTEFSAMARDAVELAWLQWQGWRDRWEKSNSDDEE